MHLEHRHVSTGGVAPHVARLFTRDHNAVIIRDRPSPTQIEPKTERNRGANEQKSPQQQIRLPLAAAAAPRGDG